MRLHALQDLQESEGCQDELALRVQQLKAELVLFKGLMSNVSAACSRTLLVNAGLRLVAAARYVCLQGCISPQLT